MSQVFHEIEKKIISILKTESKLTPEKLEKSTQLSPDQIRRGIEWLKLKDLAIVNESKNINFSLGKNGLESFQKGLPERRLLDLIKNTPRSIPDLQKELGSVFGPAIGLAKRNDWINSNGNEISLKNYPSSVPGEKTLKQIGGDSISETMLEKNDLASLLKRPDFLVENIVKTKEISLSKNAQTLDVTSSNSGAIDVEANVPEVFVARTHPLKDTIDEIREIFVTLGFTEILGNLTQPSFWNFDALFTPQDHPARELQDTFYLDGVSTKKIGTSEQIRKVSESHKKNWRYYWDINEARKMVLRTHTTCVTIKHLAENKPDEARVFSLGRVFRNEKVSYKHLVEFNQIE
ncbi:MAG: phenylalanine--tRNA ligase subunit alpha, partial [Nitrosopumilus sp.]|nr:phenylalanine--tRNA ligase subunit alpha [Nitrosopumilus sp.]